MSFHIVPSPVGYVHKINARRLQIEEDPDAGWIEYYYSGNTAGMSLLEVELT